MDQLEKLFSTPTAHFEFKVATATLGSTSRLHTPCAAGQFFLKKITQVLQQKHAEHGNL
jgi:hypothetical protein